MNRYIKPNVNLKFSLHDTRITNLYVSDESETTIDGKLIFEFNDGYYKVEKSYVIKTGKAKILISGIDFDYSSVYCIKGNSRKKVSFEQLSKDIEVDSIEVVSETYGYNTTIFRCYMYKESKDFEVEIEIYHFNESVYEWI